MKHNVYTVGIDLAKKIFHLVGTDTTGKIVWRKRLTRHALMSFMAQLPPVTIGLEACGGAHYWARQFRHQGHQVKLMVPQFVKPYVKSNKNGCVPPFTHGVFASAVRLALPPVLREPRNGKPAPPAEPVCSPSCRTSVLFLADM
jgi:hypothetical protein